MAKTKALISFAVTAKLICVFVFVNAKCWFSHDAAHLCICIMIFLDIMDKTKSLAVVKHDIDSLRVEAIRMAKIAPEPIFLRRLAKFYLYLPHLLRNHEHLLTSTNLMEAIVNKGINSSHPKISVIVCSAREKRGFRAVWATDYNVNVLWLQWQKRK